MTTITQACLDWIRWASPNERRTYIDTGSRGPGRPIDLRPKSSRAADVAKVLGLRSQPRKGASSRDQAPSAD